MCLFTFKLIVPRLIEQDDIISYGDAENGSCLGCWNGFRWPCLYTPLTLIHSLKLFPFQVHFSVHLNIEGYQSTPKLEGLGSQQTLSIC